MATKGTSKQELDSLRQRFPGREIDKVFVTGLLTHPNKLSGSRAHLFSTHIKKSLVLNNGETPYVYTGYEYAFGQRSNAMKKADATYQIIGKIYKHTELPNMTYILILKNVENNVYHIEEISHYESLAEMHGYIRRETNTDKYSVGSIISKGETFYQGTSIDEYENYRYGINANVAFVNTLTTVADAIMISDEFARKASFHTIEESEITLGNTSLLLNYYGNENFYKCLPSLGQDISENGILCIRRHIDFSTASSMVTNSSLSTIMETDEIFRGKGKVIDIDIKVNRPNELLENKDPYMAQIKFLFEDQLRYYKGIYDALHDILKNRKAKYTYELKHMYDYARNYISDIYLDTNQTIQWANNNGKFENIHLSVKVAYNKVLDYADKLTNRSSAKGVISAIVPKEQMYRDEYGNYCDVLLAGKGIIGRLNIAQVYEHELNFISNRIVQKVKEIPLIEDKFKLIIEFITKVNQEQGKELEKYWKKLKKTEREKFIDDIEEKGQIYLFQPPFYDNITFSQLAHLYDYYKIKPGYARFRMRFKKNQYQDDSLISEEEYKRNQMLYNYIITDNMDTYKIDFKKYMDLESNDKFTKGKDGREYIKGKKVTMKDRIAADNNSIWKKLASGLQIVKNAFDDFNKKSFNSSKSQVIIDQNGDLIRDMRTVQPLIIAKLYMMVLKQISDTGFSARSLGAISHLGLAIKEGKVDSGYPFIHSPIKFSFMDICNVSIMVPMEIVHRFKSIHASNPELRQEMAEVLLTYNPFQLHNLSVKLEETANDIPARMWRAYFWGMHIAFLENNEADPFDKYDAPEYSNMSKIYKKFKDIDVPIEQIRREL